MRAGILISLWIHWASSPEWHRNLRAAETLNPECGNWNAPKLWEFRGLRAEWAVLWAHCIQCLLHTAPSPPTKCWVKHAKKSPLRSHLDQLKVGISRCGAKPPHWPVFILPGRKELPQQAMDSMKCRIYKCSYPSNDPALSEWFVFLMHNTEITSPHLWEVVN